MSLRGHNVNTGWLLEGKPPFHGKLQLAVGKPAFWNSSQQCHVIAVVLLMGKWKHQAHSTAAVKYELLPRDCVSLRKK